MLHSCVVYLHPKAKSELTVQVSAQVIAPDTWNTLEEETWDSFGDRLPKSKLFNEIALRLGEFLVSVGPETQVITGLPGTSYVGH